MLPAGRPKQKEAATRETLAALGVRDAVAVLVVRGYYARSMGPTRGNDRGIYDDAAFIVGPGFHAAFNFNADPSRFRKGVATLATGVHRYKPGLHGVSFKRPGYPIAAFIPASAGKVVPVYRDGSAARTTGVALNIHPGGHGTTSSEGCLTVPPGQWELFRVALMAQLEAAGVREFPVAVVSNEG